MFVYQLKQMEEKLNNCETQKEITALRQKLVLLDEEKKESSTRCFKAEQELKDLKITGEVFASTAFHRLAFNTKKATEDTDYRPV